MRGKVPFNDVIFDPLVFTMVVVVQFLYQFVEVSMNMRFGTRTSWAYRWEIGPTLRMMRILLKMRLNGLHGLPLLHLA